MLLTKKSTTCKCIEASVLPVPRPQGNHKDKKNMGELTKGVTIGASRGRKVNKGTIYLYLLDMYVQNQNSLTMPPVHKRDKKERG